MLLKYIIWGFVIYLLYKFIFELVIPVGKATSQVKDKLREMQEQQAQQQFQQQQQAKPQQQQAEPVKGGDYIEFEEVK
jgi:Sec-independent protein translocase protein TatA